MPISLVALFLGIRHLYSEHNLTCQLLSEHVFAFHHLHSRAY